MTTVQNRLSARCKSLRHIGGGVYEYGWLVYNKRDRNQDYFNCVSKGTLEEAQAWMSAPIDGARRRVFRELAQRG